MCYSWYEDVKKTAQNEVAEEAPRKTAPEAKPETPVRSERSTFRTFTLGRRVRTAEEATPDHTLEKV